MCVTNARFQMKYLCQVIISALTAGLSFSLAKEIILYHLFDFWQGSLLSTTIYLKPTPTPQLLRGWIKIINTLLNVFSSVKQERVADPGWSTLRPFLWSANHSFKQILVIFCVLLRLNKQKHTQLCQNASFCILVSSLKWLKF